MSAKIRTIGVLGALVLMSLAGCIVTPIGEGHGGGREHEDRDGRDRGGEHRHDFGVTQKERFGFYQPYATPGAVQPVRPAVYAPATYPRTKPGIWS